MRGGFTLVELVATVALVGLLAVMAVPRIGDWADRAATERAIREVASFYWQARSAAVAGPFRVRLEFDADSLRAYGEGREPALIIARPGPNAHGVSLTASRRTIRLGPTGLGWGAANTTVVVRRGAAAESLTTSRLGRLKRWY